MKKKLRYLVAALAVAFVAALAPVSAVHAQGSDSYDCSSHFLGLRAWYDGLLMSTTPDKNGECQLKSPDDMDSNKEAGLRKYVWTIVMNVVSMIFGIVGYLAIGFVIWGGFQYILAQGDVAKTMKGKKTVTNAIVGLVIVMTASIIAGSAVMPVGLFGEHKITAEKRVRSSARISSVSRKPSFSRRR